MNKNIFLIFLSSLFLLSFISATTFGNQDNVFYVNDGITIIPSQMITIQQNQPYDLHLHVINDSDGAYLTNSTSTCTIHVHNSDGEHSLINLDIPYNSSETSFEIKFNATNFTSLGIGNYVIRCFTASSSGEISANFEVTPSGKIISQTKIIAYALIFLFFIGLILTFYFITKRVDYEKWHNSIIEKYEHRNYLKVLIYSLGYNVMKNSFIWYYLAGLPLMLIITDISYVFDVESMISLMKVLLGIYWFGFILVGVFFFGYLQEWISKLIDEIKSLDMGV